MKMQNFGTTTVELTAREFELLAKACDIWEELVSPGRSNSELVSDIEDVLRQFKQTYEKRPF